MAAPISCRMMLPTCILLLAIVVSSSARDANPLSQETAAVRDEYGPVYNPVTTPATMVPAVVTVPSTSPATYPPSQTPFTIPPLYPGQIPVTNPGIYPVPTPATTVPATTPYPGSYNPVMPTPDTAAPVVPVTTPTTPVYNPVTTYQGGTPAVTTPDTTPGMPTTAGQTWCVAKMGIPDVLLQNGLDYACGVGGVDCSPLQPMGLCFNPNTLQAHASYAFNSYYQRNPSPASCDFGGAGTLVNTNPSSGTCIYQASNAGVQYSPFPTSAGSGSSSGSTVLNAADPSSGAQSAQLHAKRAVAILWLLFLADFRVDMHIQGRRQRTAS